MSRGFKIFLIGAAFAFLIILVVGFYMTGSVNQKIAAHSRQAATPKMTREQARMEIIQGFQKNARVVIAGRPTVSVLNFFNYAGLRLQDEGKALEIEGWDVGQDGDNLWVSFAWKVAGVPEVYKWRIDLGQGLILALTPDASGIKLVALLNGD